MSIADWFSARESRALHQGAPSSRDGGSADVPDGVWVKCDGCKQHVYEGELAENLRVCPHCGHHFDLTAPQRIELLVDEGSLRRDRRRPRRRATRSGSPRPSPTPTSSPAAAEKSGLTEAVVTGRATIGGRPVVVGVMDFRFIGASMGSVVGEKITRAFELATAERLPIVLVTASGGARMQEGMLSLMQMAKTSAAARSATPMPGCPTSRCSPIPPTAA